MKTTERRCPKCGVLVAIWLGSQLIPQGHQIRDGYICDNCA